MAAVLFPTIDVLRIVLANGVAPRDVTAAPARAGADSQGRTWIEPSRSLSRETLAALGRLGVQSLHAGDSAAESVQSWAELLPLKPAAIPAGRVLFEMPDAMLPQVAAACRRLGATTGNVRLLDGEARAWLLCESPPTSLLLRCQEADSPIEAFVEQAAGIWVLAGWSHPLPEQLVKPAGSVLCLRPACSVSVRSASVPLPSPDEYALARRERSREPSHRKLAVPVRVVLQRSSVTPRELAWVFPGDSAARFWEFCAGANERLLRQFEAASTSFGGTRRVIVRPAAGLRIPPFLPLAADGYYPDPRVPGLFVPSRWAVRPLLRQRELTQLLSVRADRFIWVEAGPRGEAIPFAVPIAAFQPVPSLLTYTAPTGVALAAERQVGEPFAFERFAPPALEPDYALEEDEPVRVGRRSGPERERRETPAVERGNWIARKVERLLKPFKRPERPQQAEASSGIIPSRKTERPPASPRVEQTLASPDALVHGHDRAARRHQLEERLLRDFPRFAPDQRAAGWTELAEVYSATGNPADAAICWINAAWDAATPRTAWLEQWLWAEHRAARQSGPLLPLERWLGEPGRFGAGRVVAAYAVLGAHRAALPADLLASLPRVIAFLDQHFDDLPARAAWLARLAVTQLCSGDALGLARWRDRILVRLRDKGPGL
ncbi:MAG TPA: hypothetical protein VN641_04825, partial [Urbifossiella sp.]|nr:hypothetical protein [Urbifossiella sp.]